MPHFENERQQSVNDIWTCKYVNWNAICLLLFIIIILAAFIGKTERDRATAPF
jgi:hypothetical protein